MHSAHTVHIVLTVHTIDTVHTIQYVPHILYILYKDSVLRAQHVNKSNFERLAANRLFVIRNDHDKIKVFV